jgi:hypothetical protein
MKLEDSAIDYDEESFESEQEKMKNDEKWMKKTVATVVTVCNGQETYRFLDGTH